jgi:hypothetical protein
VRPILVVLGSWVMMSVPVSLLVGSVLKRLDTEAGKQASTAKVLEPHSAKLYRESSTRPAAQRHKRLTSVLPSAVFTRRRPTVPRRTAFTSPNSRARA